MRFPDLTTLEILRLPNRDYRYRLVMPKDVWVKVVAALAQEQEWSNFKNEAGSFQGAVGADYTHALHEVWNVMCRLQEKAKVEKNGD